MQESFCVEMESNFVSMPPLSRAAGGNQFDSMVIVCVCARVCEPFFVFMSPVCMDVFNETHHSCLRSTSHQ